MAEGQQYHDGAGDVTDFVRLKGPKSNTAAADAAAVAAAAILFFENHELVVCVVVAAQLTASPEGRVLIIFCRICTFSAGVVVTTQPKISP